MTVADLNYFLATATIALQLIAVVLLVVFVMRKRVPSFESIAQQVSRRGLWIAFAASLGALIVAEYYKILGFEACPLCWWQEIFLYPQVVLFGMAAWKKDFYIADYSIVLSVLGAGVALYQHVLQMFGEGSLPCPAVGTGPSCAQRILFEFGYMTFPLMAFTVFVFLIILMLFVRSRRI